MKPQTLAFTVFFLLLLLAGGWLALSGLDGAAMPPVPVRASSLDLPAPEASALASQGGAGPSDAGRLDADQTNTAAARESVAVSPAMMPPPEDAQWIEIRVIDKQSREPVPFATVGWVDQRTADTLGGSPEGWLRPYGVAERTELLARACGWLGTADQQGVARIQRSSGTAAFARSGSRFGYDLFDRSLVAPKSGFELEIEEDLTLRVQVLTAAGAPAVGVLVGVLVCGKNGQIRVVYGHDSMALTRGPEGIAELAHVQYLREDYSRSVAAGAVWSVGVLAPALAGEPIPLSLDPLPEHLLQLRLPATGHLRVRIQPQLGPSSKVFMLTSHGQEGGAFGEVAMRAVGDDDGWATFSHLPLGREFDVMGFGSSGLLQRRLAGPTVPDTTVDVELGHGPTAILMSGRLLDAQRQPFADVPVVMRMRGMQQEFTAHGRTDGDGRFLLNSRAFGAEVEVQSITVEVLDAEIGAWSVRLPGRMLRPGIEPLGDLVLGREAVFVSGQFTVDGVPGKPSASLQLQRQTMKEDRSLHWVELQGVKPLVRRDGQFEVRGSMMPGRYRLSVQSTKLLPIKPVEFEAGTTGLLVPLQTGCSLSVVVLMPQGGYCEPVAELLLVELAAEGPAVADNRNLKRRSLYGSVPSVQFDWHGLRPGKYRLQLSLEGLPDVLEVLDDVLLPQAEPPDPRLMEIDLRPRLRLQPLRLLDAEGRDVDARNCVLLPLPIAAQGSLAALPWWFETRNIWLPQRDLELLVLVRGHQPQRVLCTGAPLEVRMAHWSTVRLRLPLVATWPAEWRLQASLEPRPEREVRRVNCGAFDGQIGPLVEPPEAWVEVRGQVVTLPVGEHAQRIRLRAYNGKVPVELPLVPQSVSAATGEYLVQVDGEAWLRALAAKGER